jgi:hypothetical protein
VRMPHLSLLQNHPYTIANLPPQPRKGGPLQQPTEFPMEFFVRARGGLTLDLAKSVDAMSRKEQAQRLPNDQPLEVHLDGPYGGLVEDLPSVYQSLVFVAGGTGISACLPHMEEACRRIANGTTSLSHIRLLWMVRSAAHIEWALERLGQFVAAAGQAAVFEFDFYVTDDGAALHEVDVESARTRSSVKAFEDTEPSEVTGSKDKTQATTPSELGTVHSRRPYIPDLLPPMLPGSGRIKVFGACWPLFCVLLPSLMLPLVKDAGQRASRWTLDVQSPGPKQRSYGGKRRQSPCMWSSLGGAGVHGAER